MATKSKRLLNIASEIKSEIKPLHPQTTEDELKSWFHISIEDENKRKEDPTTADGATDGAIDPFAVVCTKQAQHRGDDGRQPGLG